MLGVPDFFLFSFFFHSFSILDPDNANGHFSPVGQHACCWAALDLYMLPLEV